MALRPSYISIYGKIDAMFTATGESIHTMPMTKPGFTLREIRGCAGKGTTALVELLAD